MPYLKQIESSIILGRNRLRQLHLPRRVGRRTMSKTREHCSHNQVPIRALLQILALTLTLRQIRTLAQIQTLMKVPTLALTRVLIPARCQTQAPTLGLTRVLIPALCRTQAPTLTLLQRRSRSIMSLQAKGRIARATKTKNAASECVSNTKV